MLGYFILENYQMVSLVFLGGLALLTIVFRERKNKKALKVLDKNLEVNALLPPTLHPKIETEKCIGCSSCVEACPEENVLALVNGKALLVGATKCVGHGECMSVCPENAISLVFGTKNVSFEMPQTDHSFQSKTKGLYLAGEVVGMGLIRNASKQGALAVTNIAYTLRENSSKNSHQFTEDDGSYDLVIVGAGPAGMAASLRASELGLKFVTLEQNALGGAIAHYPRQKLVMSTPLDLPLVGKIKFKKNHVFKEELLAYWEKWMKQFNLPIKEGVKLENIELKNTEEFLIHTNEFSLRTKKILLCIGVGGSPRKLNVSGEESSTKVFYRLASADDFKGKTLIVVGGGNSAAECALALSERTLNNRVILLVRGKSMDRANAENIEKVMSARDKGFLQVNFEAQIESIDMDKIEYSVAGNGKMITVDGVFVLVGQEKPFNLLRSWGIKTKEYFGETLTSFLLAFTLLFLGACQPETPTIANSNSSVTQFSHEGLTDTCMNCHEKDRPEAGHFAGQDCVSCHKVESWKDEVHYSHVPSPESCIQCHSSDRPKVDHGQGLDCVQCHNVNTWEKNVMYHHNPKPVSCRSCHEQARPSKDHGQRLDCVECHLTSKWNRDHFYSHDPTPKNCQNCHENKRPLKTMYPEPVNEYRQGHFENSDCTKCHKTVAQDHKWVFDHGSADDKNINYCLPCHTERGKKKHFYGGAIGWFKGEGKCHECHTNRRSWEAP